MFYILNKDNFILDSLSKLRNKLDGLKKLNEVLILNTI